MILFLPFAIVILPSYTNTTKKNWKEFKYDTKLIEIHRIRRTVRRVSHVRITKTKTVLHLPIFMKHARDWKVIELSLTLIRDTNELYSGSHPRFIKKLGGPINSYIYRSG